MKSVPYVYRLRSNNEVSPIGAERAHTMRVMASLLGERKRYRGPGFIPLASIILRASGERRKSRKAFAVWISFAPDTKKA